MEIPVPYTTVCLSVNPGTALGWILFVIVVVDQECYWNLDPNNEVGFVSHAELIQVQSTSGGVGTDIGTS